MGVEDVNGKNSKTLGEKRKDSHPFKCVCQEKMTKVVLAMAIVTIGRTIVMIESDLIIEAGAECTRLIVIVDHPNNPEHAQILVMSARETGLRHRPRKQPAPAVDNYCAANAALRIFQRRFRG